MSAGGVAALKTASELIEAVSVVRESRTVQTIRNPYYLNYKVILYSSTF